MIKCVCCLCAVYIGVSVCVWIRNYGCAFASVFPSDKIHFHEVVHVLYF